MLPIHHLVTTTPPMLPMYKTMIGEMNKTFTLMQTEWSKQINPLLALPLASSNLLRHVSLSTGTNQINHKLARKLIGWMIVRQRSAANVYDDQDNNQSPTLTLTLVSSANVNVDLLVF